MRLCMINWSPLTLHDMHALLGIVVCVIGIGALSMAYAFAQAGPVYGSVAFFVMCFFNIYSTILLSKVMISAPSYVETFSDLGYYVGGKWGRRSVQITQILTCLLVPIAFLILGGAALLPGIFKGAWEPSSSVWIILMAISLMPFALIQNLKEAFSVMILGTATAFFAIFVSVGQTVAVKSWGDFEASEVESTNVLSVFGSFALAYGAAIIVPTVQRNHPEPQKLPMNIFLSMLVISIIYIIIAVLGYAQFGCAAPSNMLLSMEDNGLRTVVFISMQIHIMISFAVIVNPALFLIERFVFGNHEVQDTENYNSQATPRADVLTSNDEIENITTSVVSPYDLLRPKNRASISSSRTGELAILAEEKHSTNHMALKDKIKSIMLRCLIVGIQTFLALLGQSSFSDISSFIGATTITACCIIIPCFFYYKQFRSEMGFAHKCLCWFVIIISAGLGIFTAVKKMEHIIHVASKYKLFALADSDGGQDFSFCPVGYANRH